MGLCDDHKPAAVNPELAAADQLFRAGKFADAENSYQSVLKTDSKLVPGQAGLVRAMLRQQKIDEALEAVNNALATQPDSAALLAAKGDVQFRRAEMSPAEMSYLAHKGISPVLETRLTRPCWQPTMLSHRCGTRTVRLL
jgi:tetratricopeptide (TPR) repeat protein